VAEPEDRQTPNTVISLSAQHVTEHPRNRDTTDGMAIALTEGEDSGFFGKFSLCRAMMEFTSA
jgi:hypothetical protein